MTQKRQVVDMFKHFDALIKRQFSFVDMFKHFDALIKRQFSETVIRLQSDGG